MSEFHFSGKVVAVTSASSALGLAVVVELIKKGATVIAQVTTAVNVPCKQYLTMNSFVEHLASLPKVDVLINLLSSHKAQLFEECNYEEVENAVNSAFLASRAVWKMMRKHKHGHILNIVPAECFYLRESTGFDGSLETKPTSVVLSVATLAWQGLVNTLKREGAKFYIRTNTLIYNLDSLALGDFTDCLIPVALFMTHNSFKESGSIIQVSSSRVSRVRIERGSGKLFKNKWSAESVSESISEVSSIGDHPDYPVAYSESLLKGFFLNVLGKPRL